MKFKNFTKEAVYELLLYLAENEEFQSVKSLKGVKKEDVYGVLQEIADQLKQEVAGEEGLNQRPHYPDFNLSPKAMALISSLSPREEMLLFKSFKII